MALKYFFEYRSFRENLWRVEIDSPTYSDDPIEIQGTDKPLTIEWNGDNDDDPFKAHIINSTIQIQVFNDNLDLNEIMLINDSSYKVRVYLNSVLHWQGSLISDGVRENDTGVAYPVTLKAIDGIELLDNTYYAGIPGWYDITVNGEQASRIGVLQRIRGILYRSQELDNVLPIRWSCSLKNLNYPTSDAISVGSPLDGRGWLTNPNLNSDNKENVKSSFWWLKNMCQSLGCWLMQREGYWYIINYADMINNNGVLDFYEIGTEIYQDITATVVSVDLNQDCNDSVNENGFWWVKKPFGSVQVTYQNTTLQGDVMPNGSFDRTSSGLLLDWGFEPNSNASPLLSIEESLSERSGNSVLISNPLPGPTQDAVFTYSNTIPLDSWKLFKNFTFGFTFAPYFGFQYDTNGVISWDNKPLQISVSFTYKGATWYLNEFGFWWNSSNAKIIQNVENYYTLPGVPYYSILFDNSLFFNVGDIVTFNFIRNGSLETWPFTFNSLTSPQDALNLFLSTIPNTQELIGNPGKRGFVIYNVTDSIQNTVITGKTQDSIEKISVSVSGAKIKDIISFAFTGKGGNSEILLPEIDNYTSGDGELKVKFFVKPGQQYGLDDVYFKVPQNNDIYTVSLSDSKNSKEEYTMDISSSFSGHLLSSYGTEYQDKNENMFWTGNKTLTQIYGESILKWRNKPCRVFEGSVDGRINWGLLDVRGIKYVPLIINFDAIDEISNITAIQARQDGDLSMTVKHTSSGDKL